MNTEQLRKMREILTARQGMSFEFFGKELLCTLLEIAAQLAELNQQIGRGRTAPVFVQSPNEKLGYRE